MTDYTPPEIDRDFATAVAADLARARHAARCRRGQGDERAAEESHRPAKARSSSCRCALMLTGMDHGPELVRAIPLLERASESDSARALAARAHWSASATLSNVFADPQAALPARRRRRARADGAADDRAAEHPDRAARHRALLRAAAERAPRVDGTDLSARRSESPPASTRTDC